MSFQATTILLNCISHYLSEWKERTFDWLLLGVGFALHSALKEKNEELKQLRVAGRILETLTWHRGNTSFLPWPIPQHWWQSGVCMLNKSLEEDPPSNTDTFIMWGQRLGQKMMSWLFSARGVQRPSAKTLMVWWMHTYISACVRHNDIVFIN